MNVAAARLFGYGFPFGTLIVNVVGSFAMGLFAGYFAFRPGIPQHLRLFLTTGILGGFTTFSTFGWDAVRMLEEGQWTKASIYVGASVLGGLIAMMLGMRVGDAL